MSACMVPVTVGPPVHSLANKTFVHHTSRGGMPSGSSRTERTSWSRRRARRGATNSFWASTAHYSATTLMKTAALDLAPAGIRVDAVSPGVVNSQPGRLSVIREVLEHALGFG